MGTRLMSAVACLLIVLHQVINEVAGDGVFSREPVDKILTVSYDGSTKSFLLDCTVTVQSIIKVSWIKNDVVISENDTLLVNRDTAHVVYDGRYAINSQDNRKFYQLIINDITPDTAAFDSGRYQCKVTWTNSGSISVDKSSVATVIIYAMPGDEYLQCTMTDSDNTQVVQILPRTIVREDETYTLKCVSENGNPAVTLSWSKSSQAEMFDVSSQGQTTDGLLFSESQWNPSIDDSISAMLLVCTMHHPQLQQDRTCTLGPFNVTYKPKVTLHPESFYIFSNGHSDDSVATFKCLIDATPKALNVTWYFDGKITKEGGHFTYEGTSLIIDGSDWEGKSNHSIECRAANALGDGSAFGVLFINTPLPATALPGAEPKLTLPPA
ncbi:uncharacterized protein [Ptychodera flava]|uniref:uncharacterized protein n=1 Tax=Ptychodera flava TaxID=63121 RepID=UPI003969C4A5